MPKRSICIHGHFYQPPRENPWLEEVEVQDSAAPFHDWNARVAAESYGPNGAARVKTAHGRICDIVDNYRLLSFNFGPTLLAWMERARPDVYRRILAADAASLVERGHGNAIAQAYSHAILPLCSQRDRRTQTLWGIGDFRHRFGREAEGMWLPETAADMATLETLAEAGIRFTVLSPYQARRVRPPGGEWQDASGAQFDPARPYRVSLGESGAIAVFFYDGPIARSLAFELGLMSGDTLLRQLASGFDEARGHDELLTVAIDGETFGHHKKGGEEALAVALGALVAQDDIDLVNLGQALERFPPEWEVEIFEGSSWSCAHGLERWRSDCGCQTGGQPEWKQHWRAPLREALDTLRDHLADIFEREGARLFVDPWRARDEFIELLVDPERRQASLFLERQAGRPLDDAEQTRALKLLEMQRHSLLMFASCGWFFSELSGIETVQVLKYAGRAIQLARELVGVDLEQIFKDSLARAPSNIPEMGDGARIYDRFVRPSVASLEQVAAHHAIASLFKEYRPDTVSCYRFRLLSRRKETAGPATLAVGRLQISSLLTREELETAFCVLHFGGSDFRCGLRNLSVSEVSELESELFSRLGQLSLAQVLREIDRVFTGRDYTLRDLFIDERRKMAALLLRETKRRYEHAYLDIYRANSKLMLFLREIDTPIPMALRVAADVALSWKLDRMMAQLEAGKGSLAVAHGKLIELVGTARRLGARLDVAAVRDAFGKLIEDRIAQLDTPGEGNPAFEIIQLIDMGERLGLPLDLSQAQDRVWAILGDRGGRSFDRDTLSRLAHKLWFDVPTLEARARANVPALEETAQDAVAEP